MRTYSEVNVMESVLEKPRGLKGVFKLAFASKNVKVIVKLPSRYVLRLQMLCQEVEDASEYKYEISDLASALLTEILRGYARAPHPWRVIGSFNNLQKSPIVIGTKHKKRHECLLKIDKDLLLQLEMLLADAEEYESHSYNAEDILELIILNFLSDLFSGTHEKIIKKLVKTHLES